MQEIKTLLMNLEENKGFQDFIKAIHGLDNNIKVAAINEYINEYDLSKLDNISRNYLSFIMHLICGTSYIVHNTISNAIKEYTPSFYETKTKVPIDLLAEEALDNQRKIEKFKSEIIDHANQLPRETSTQQDFFMYKVQEISKIHCKERLILNRQMNDIKDKIIKEELGDIGKEMIEKWKDVYNDKKATNDKHDEV